MFVCVCMSFKENSPGRTDSKGSKPENSEVLEKEVCSGRCPKCQGLSSATLYSSSGDHSYRSAEADTLAEAGLEPTAWPAINRTREEGSVRMGKGSPQPQDLSKNNIFWKRQAEQTKPSAHYIASRLLWQKLIYGRCDDEESSAAGHTSLLPPVIHPCF